MFILSQIVIWGCLALFLVLLFFSHLEQLSTVLPFGKTLLAGVVDHDIRCRQSQKSLVVFCLKYKQSPDAGELLEIASTLSNALIDGPAVKSDPELRQFIEAVGLLPQKPNQRVKIPSSLSQGYDLYLSSIDLMISNCHPTFPQDRVIPIRVTGKRRGKIAHIHWVSGDAQDLFEYFQIAGY